MTKLLFQQNEELRSALRAALRPNGFLALALLALDAQLESEVAISHPTDLARDALRNAQHLGAIHYKSELLSLTEKPPEETAPLQADYSGKAPFEAAADIPLPGE